MINKITYNFAIKTLIIIPSLLVIFHILNLLGFISANIVWLGKIHSDNKMIVFGIFSIFLNLIIIFCALVKGSIIKGIKYEKYAERIIPFMFWWLIGNTMANLFSKSSFELIVFTPILILLTICFYKIKGK